MAHMKVIPFGFYTKLFKIINNYMVMAEVVFTPAIFTTLSFIKN